MTVAPEDLRRGDDIAVLTAVYEFPSFDWFDLPLHPPEEPIRVRMIPRDSGLPLKVQAVCLPFVCARDPDGCSITLDVRRVHIVRVSRAYARCVWKQIRKQRERERREL